MFDKTFKYFLKAINKTYKLYSVTSLIYLINIYLILFPKKFNEKKILILATSQVTIESFLLPHIEKLKKKYDITILTKLNFNRLVISEVKIYNINIDRKINILNDFKNVIFLYKLFKI